MANTKHGILLATPVSWVIMLRKVIGPNTTHGISFELVRCGMASGILRAPRWARAYQFSIMAPKGMSDRALKRWKPMLDQAQKIAETESVPLRLLRIHHHPNNPMDCAAGAAYEKTNEIMMCTVPSDMDTLLHEFAHLLAHGGHTEAWAETCFFLYRRYLPKHEIDFAVWEACRVYKNARVVFRRQRKEKKLRAKKAVATRRRRGTSVKPEKPATEGPDLRGGLSGDLPGSVQPVDRPTDEVRLCEYLPTGPVRSDKPDSERQDLADSTRDERLFDCG